MTNIDFLLSIAKYILCTFVLTPLSALATLVLDKRKVKPMLKGLMCYPLFLGSWILINIKALIKPDTTWTKIEHTRSVKVNELSNN